MKQRKVMIIVVAAFITIAVGFYYIFLNAPVRYQWFENYRATSEEPYGAAFIFNMMKTYRRHILNRSFAAPHHYVLYRIDK